VEHLGKREFTIVTGARQTGKSTILHELMKMCKSLDKPSIFINLENKTVLAELDANPLNLLSYLPSQDKRNVVFLDEIQYLSDPSNFLKLLYDDFSDKVKIVASGSSAFYRDTKFKDSLAGRKRIFQLWTCDFEEFLSLQGKEELWGEISLIRQNPKFKSLKLELLRLEWENYMLYGGYPAVVVEPAVAEKIEMLKEIRDSFVKRDIVESGVQNELVFYQMFQLLAGQSGQLVNTNELSNTLKIRNETTQNYLEVMEKCFHVTLLKPFSANLRKELVKMPKAYFLDTGLRNCLLNNFQPINQRLDKGELWEQAFFRLLVDKYGIDEIRFWRTADGKEIDFILPNQHPPLAIETKFDREQFKIKKYRVFLEAYPTFKFSVAALHPWSESFFRDFL